LAIFDCRLKIGSGEQSDRPAFSIRNPQSEIRHSHCRLPISDRRLGGIRRLGFSNPQSEIRNPQFRILGMKLVGSNPNPQIEGLDRLPGISNYFIGNDPKKWRTNVPNYARVRYREVYPGIDLVYYGNQGPLEYDLIVAPGADPNIIRLAYQGAESMCLDGQGIWC
jgi:hypothetical protein